jgi:hypothetical protein
MLSKIVWKVYSEAAPYISNFRWLKEFLAGLIDKGVKVEDFEKMLEDELKVLDEATKKTDLKIFLMYWKRMRS